MQLGHAVAKTVVWFVEDFVRRGLKSGRRYGPGSEVFDSLNLRLEFGGPFRPGFEEGLPARLNVILLERVSPEHVRKGRPQWLGSFVAHHLWERIGKGVDEQGAACCATVAHPSGVGFKAHEVAMESWVLLAFPCTVWVEEVSAKTSRVGLPQGLVHLGRESARLRGEVRSEEVVGAALERVVNRRTGAMSGLVCKCIYNPGNNSRCHGVGVVTEAVSLCVEERGDEGLIAEGSPACDDTV